MTDPARRRLLVRLVSAGAAVALVVALAVMLLSGRNTAPTRSSEAFCQRISDVSALSDALAVGDGSQIRAATERLHQAEEVAPLDIQPQMQVLVDYADGLERTIATAANDPGGVDEALKAAVRAQQGTVGDVVAAGNAVKYYAKATCDLDLTDQTN